MPHLHPERLSALDSLRGIAALAVVLMHTAVNFELVDVFDGVVGLLVRWTPLRLVLGGRQAVLLFFVLSGYALSCAVLGDRAYSYPHYLVRRVCRIWLPCAATILLAAAVWKMIPPHGLPGSEGFANPSAFLSQDGRLILGHLAMTGVERDLSLIPQGWSLVYEMRISVIFPLLLLFCRKDLLLTLAAAAVMHVGANAAIGCETAVCIPFASGTLGGTFLLTVYFVVFFVLGVALALKRPWLDRRLRNVPGWIKALLWTGTVAALTLGYRTGAAADVVFGVASAMLIALVAVSPGAQRMLSWSPFAWLGRISYSLYLTHWVVMSVMNHLMRGLVPDPLLALGFVAVSLLVAVAMHQLVEAPSQRLGKSLTRTSHRRRLLGGASAK